MSYMKDSTKVITNTADQIFSKSTPPQDIHNVLPLMFACP